LPRSRPVHQARLPHGMVRTTFGASNDQGDSGIWPAR
jgi:hypothetical protein